MKTYINISERCIKDTERDVFIPKNADNRDYAEFLELQALSQAELVEPQIVTPVTNWITVRLIRDLLLKESDWTTSSDAPIANKEAWIEYRQALRDLPETYSDPNEVVWPVKPA
jgi:hypothetical protein